MNVGELHERHDGTRPEAASAEAERFRLAVQLDRLEACVERLLVEAEHTKDDVHAITRYLTTRTDEGPAERSLAEVLARVQSTHERLEDLAGGLNRLSREQFKANALHEATTEQVREALAALQEIATRREDAHEARVAEEARRPAELRAEGRVEMAVGLLPVLDGMDRALESGASLLERLRASAGEPEDRPGGEPQGLLRAVLQALGGGSTGPVRGGPTSAAAAATAPSAEAVDALQAWLEGLELGRERFLALLAEEGIRPIPALHEPFDPHLHAAVASEERHDVTPGTVIGVLRTGYRRGDRSLRFAEVVVSRAAEQEASSGAAVGPGANGEEDLPPA